MKRDRATTLIVTRALLLACLATLTISCASTRNVNYEGYVKIPDKPSTVCYRTLLKTNPYTAKRAFYGNYGGSGCLGGRPVDEMDDCFRRHDVVYRIAKSRRTMVAADEELVKRLESIDDDALSQEGREYRERAIKFMNSSMAGVIGKPFSAGLRRHEPEGSYFSGLDRVQLFFDPSHPGFPERSDGSVAGAAVLMAAPMPMPAPGLALR